MNFPRVDAALEECRAHLDATGTRNTEIESYLVGYLLAVIYAEFEQKLRAVVCKRVERTGDDHVHSFSVAVSKAVVRNIKVSDIKGVLGYFDQICKELLGLAIDGEIQAAYDNIINNRHSLAHASGANMTFAELESSLSKAKGVIGHTADSIGLTAAEIASL